MNKNPWLVLLALIAVTYAIFSTVAVIAVFIAGLLGYVPAQVVYTSIGLAAVGLVVGRLGSGYLWDDSI